MWCVGEPWVRDLPSDGVGVNSGATIALRREQTAWGNSVTGGRALVASRG